MNQKKENLYSGENVRVGSEGSNLLRPCLHTLAMVRIFSGPALFIHSSSIHEHSPRVRDLPGVKSLMESKACMDLTSPEQNHKYWGRTGEPCGFD